MLDGVGRRSIIGSFLSDFCSTKRLGVFLLPPGWDASPTQGLPPPPPSVKFAGTHLYTWVERGTVRVKCLAQEHNTIFQSWGPFLESPETLRAIFGCHNPLVPVEWRGFNSSNFTVISLFVTLKTCQKIGFPKQAVGSFTKVLSGPKRFRDFRETGPRTRTRTTRSGIQCTNHETSVPPTLKKIVNSQNSAASACTQLPTPSPNVGNCWFCRCWICFGDHGTKEMLWIVGWNVWPVSNFEPRSQSFSSPSPRGRKSLGTRLSNFVQQQHATGCANTPNNVGTILANNGASVCTGL